MKEDSPIKKRMLQLAKKLELTANQFSIKIGKDRSYIPKIGSEISTDVLRNIFITFPDVNILWIITGEGEMLLTDENKPEQELINELKRLNKTNSELQERYEKVLIELGRYKERLDKYESSTKIEQAV